MQREVARDRDPPRGRAARPQLHGHGRLDDQQRHLHRRRLPVAAARPRRRARPVGQRHRRVHPCARDADRVQPRSCRCGAEVVLDLCDYLAYCLDDPETHAVMLFVEGFKRPERFLALADHALAIGKPILAVKVGRCDQAQDAAIAHSGSLAGEDRVTDAALDAAGVIRCADLDELLEAAELVAGARAAGAAVARRADGRRDGVDRRGVARRRPRADGRASTCRRSRTTRARRSCATCRRWATSATRSTRGARRRRAIAYRRVVRGAGRVRRLRRARRRARLPVPRAAQRGRRGHHGEPRARRGDGRRGRRSCRCTCR